MTIITAVGAEAINLPDGSAMATQFAPVTARLESRVAAVAKVAAVNAAAVDHDSRFPAEALATASTRGLLGIMVPREPGGEQVEASEHAVAIVLAALRASGLIGYRNDNQFTTGRYLRDILSSPLMINNDRILSSLGATALMGPLPAGLREPQA